MPNMNNNIQINVNVANKINPYIVLTFVCCSHSPRHMGPADGFHANLTTAISSSSMSSVNRLSSLSLELDKSLSDTFSESLWSVKEYIILRQNNETCTRQQY